MASSFNKVAQNDIILNENDITDEQINWFVTWLS